MPTMNTSRSFNRISTLLTSRDGVPAEEQLSPESRRRLRQRSGHHSDRMSSAPIEVIIDSSHHSNTTSNNCSRASSPSMMKHGGSAAGNGVDDGSKCCCTSSSNTCSTCNDPRTNAPDDDNNCNGAPKHNTDNNSRESKIEMEAEYIINTNFNDHEDDDDDSDDDDDQSLGDGLALPTIDSDKNVGSADRGAGTTSGTSSGMPDQVHAAAAPRRFSCTGAYMGNAHATRSNPSTSSSAHHIAMSSSMSSLRSLNLGDDGSAHNSVASGISSRRAGRRPSLRRRHSIASAISTANLSAEERLEQNSIDSLPYSRRGSLSSVVTEIHPLSIGEDFVLSDSESDDDSVDDSGDGF